MKNTTKLISAFLLFILAIFLFVSSVSEMGNKRTQIQTEMTIEDSIPWTQGMEFNFTIDNKADYIADITWRSRNEETPRFVTAATIFDSTGQEIVSYIGDEIDLSTESLNLNKGYYTVKLFTFATSDEAEEFRVAHNASVYISKDFKGFANDSSCQMEYFFNINPEFDIVSAIKICISIIAAVACGLLFSVSAFTKNNANPTYDERQIANRGIAYKFSFLTLIIYSFSIAILLLLDFSLPISTAFWIFLGGVITTGVFITISIWKDCYFAINSNISKVITLLIVLTITSTLLTIADFRNGLISFALLKLMITILFGYSAIVAIIKVIVDKKEAE